MDVTGLKAMTWVLPSFIPVSNISVCRVKHGQSRLNPSGGMIDYTAPAPVQRTPGNNVLRGAVCRGLYVEQRSKIGTVKFITKN